MELSRVKTEPDQIAGKDAGSVLRTVQIRLTHGRATPREQQIAFFKLVLFPLVKIDPHGAQRAEAPVVINVSNAHIPRLPRGKRGRSSICPVFRPEDGQLTERADRPSHWLRHRIPEHLDEQRREDAVDLGVGVGAEAAQVIGLVEDLDDAALLGEGRQGNLVLPELCHDYTRHLCSCGAARGKGQKRGRTEVVGKKVWQQHAEARSKRHELCRRDACRVRSNNLIQVRTQLRVENIVGIESECGGACFGRRRQLHVDDPAGAALNLIQREMPDFFIRRETIGTWLGRSDSRKRCPWPTQDAASKSVRRFWRPSWICCSISRTWRTSFAGSSCGTASPTRGLYPDAARLKSFSAIVSNRTHQQRGSSGPGGSSAPASTPGGFSKRATL